MGIKLSSAFIASEDQMASTLYGSSMFLLYNVASSTQGTWTDAYTSGRVASWFVNNQTGAGIGDNFTTSPFYLEKGTYTFNHYGGTGTSNGIVDIYLNTTKIVENLDLFSGSVVAGTRQTTTGIVVPTSGYYTLKLNVVGKNAGSSSYQAQSSAFEFKKTA